MRLARASVVATATVVLALVAHVLGGGAPPSVVVLGPLVAVTLAATVPFTGRRISPLGAVALLGAGQLLLHHAFELFGTMGCAPTGEPGAGMAGHVHAAQTVGCTVSTSHADALAGSVLGASAMLVVHVVATLLTALLIAGTDQALAWVVTWLRPLVALLTPVLLPAFAPLPVKVAMPGVVARRDVGVVPLRGPPRVALRLA